MVKYRLLKPFIFFSLIVLSLLFCINACSREEAQQQASEHPTSLVVTETADTVTCRLPNGGVTVIPKHPQRTVVLLTSLLNLWVEAGGKAVGRCSGKINVPPEVRDIPELGSFNNPNVEKIIALRPDLVIASDLSNFRSITPIFEENGIPYVFLRYINHHDYLHILEVFATLNGTQDEYRTNYDRLTQKANAIIDRCRNDPAPKVLIVFTTTNSVSCELPCSQTGVMLSMLGARNVIPAKYYTENKTRIDFSLERIVQLDPDIILLNTMGEVEACRQRLRSEFESNAAWSSLRAIRDNRFYVLPKKYFLYKPNEKFPEALAYLAGLLYPGFDHPSSAANRQ